MTLKTTQIPSLPSAELVEATFEQVKSWVAESKKLRINKPSKRLAGLLQDARGLEFAVGFIDGVIRPEDLRVAASNLYRLRTITPKFLPVHLRLMIALGANFGVIFPWPVIPIARAFLRQLVSHLVLDATRAKLNKSTKKLGLSEAVLNINLLGEAVLGKSEADKRLNSVKEILSRKETEYVSVKVSAIVSPHSPWAFDQAVAEVVQRLLPLYEIANSANPKKFINLDMEEYRDLDLTIAVFKSLLQKPQFKNLTAGIVLQAYLPDALRAMIDLQQWAELRVLQGGAPIKVRVVKGANLPMERVDSELHGWPLATVSSKAEADANYKRVLNYALTENRIKNVHIGVAGHNLFDLAWAWLLASQRGAQQGLDFEMLLGMAPNQAKVISKTVGKLVLYTPIVYPKEFDVAIAYLIRRLEEGATKDNFLSSAFQLDSKEYFDLEAERFRQSIALLDTDVPIPNRIQNRLLQEYEILQGRFTNAADTDSAIPENREWAKTIFRRLADSEIGEDLVVENTIEDQATLNKVIDNALVAQQSWSGLSLLERSKYLLEAAVVLEKNREYLIEVAMSEAGKTLDQIDTEVSEAIDFANYYGKQALRLGALPGAIAVARKLTVVTPPWNFPVAIPAGGILAALAAGSAVIFKPAGPAKRCGAVLAALLLEVLPPGVLTPIHIGEKELGRELIAHPSVDQVILTGGYETAQLFKQFKPDLRVLAETSGKNAIIVTPHADLDLAAKDVAYSAFGHAGQKCSASSIVILVGSAAKSRRFRSQLKDAVKSLKVDFPNNPAAQMGPVITAPEGKLKQGLTTLEKGERWFIEPKQLSEDGKLWSPGVRENVQFGSTSHKVEYFGPVLAIMTAKNLEQAIRIQNSVDYGLTAGLHSLSPEEINLWLRKVEAGNVYVNRGITGAIVRRQAFGGWKKSSVGPTAKAGGPNYLFCLTDWKSTSNLAKEPIGSKKLEELMVMATASELTDLEVESLVRAAQSDLAAINQYFTIPQDESGLSVEINALRYFRSDCTIRIQADASDYQIMRALVTALALGKSEVSTQKLPDRILKFVRKAGVSVKIEDSTQWLNSVKQQPRRLRVIGQVDLRLPELANPDVAVYSGEQTESGIIELLPFFKEQAVSITAHRFGNPARHLSLLRL
jgi:RHH-type proline utilization regulon transcriptional repressor/proline dehydrogenase/delta 1-pyrroline-5-carboxylate dehydrogenase